MSKERLISGGFYDLATAYQSMQRGADSVNQADSVRNGQTGKSAKRRRRQGKLKALFQSLN